MNPLVLLPFLLIFPLSAESHVEKSTSQDGADKGLGTLDYEFYRDRKLAAEHEEQSTSQDGTEKGLGTLDYEFYRDRGQLTEKNKENIRRPRIVGRDMGGHFDKTRVQDEALDLKPRDPSGFQRDYPIPQN